MKAYQGMYAWGLCPHLTQAVYLCMTVKRVNIQEHFQVLEGFITPRSVWLLASLQADSSCLSQLCQQLRTVLGRVVESEALWLLLVTPLSLG